MPRNSGKEKTPWVSFGPHDPAFLKSSSRFWADGYHYDEQVCGGDMGEKQRMVHVVVRDISEEMRTVTKELMLAACLPARTRVLVGPGLLPRAMSASLALPHLSSVLMPVIHVATRATGMPGVWAGICGNFEVSGLCCHRRSCVELSDPCCHWGT